MIAVPETLHGLIAARLDALAGEEKELLQDAAVMGKVFWTGALAVDPKRSFAATLHALERKEFIRRERGPSIEGESEYAFPATCSSATSPTGRSHGVARRAAPGHGGVDRSARASGRSR